MLKNMYIKGIFEVFLFIIKMLEKTINYVSRLLISEKNIFVLLLPFFQNLVNRRKCFEFDWIGYGC